MAPVASPEIPKDGLAGLKQNWRTDIVSGFIIFLIALPLSLGIALASGLPPLAGIFSAIVGGMIVSQISGSYVTINGPAAGLIVVIIAAVDKLGQGDVVLGYHTTLAAIVVAGVSLTVLGLLKAGKLGAFFPSTVVHGMLASIGVVIMVKQLPFVLGCKPPAKEPLLLIAKIPEMFANLTPEIAVIGITCLIILIMHTLIKNKLLQKIPAPIIVVAVSIGLGLYFHLGSAHADIINGHQYAIDPLKVLVVLPGNIVAGITHPDWSKIGTLTFWSCALSITLVQGIESLLSASAVDKLDPFRRQSNLSRDVAAVGFGTAVSGMIGGLPMIAEIVRSSANISNGARTRWANFFHGTFMLIMILACGQLIGMIPMAALAALLVFTGYRLASPRVFRETYQVGSEQILLFVITLVTALATDLLIGVSVGIIAKFILHIARGAELKNLFKVDATVTNIDSDHYTVALNSAAVFSNYLSLGDILDKLPRHKTIVVDLSKSRLVDHSVMEHLSHYEREYVHDGGIFEVMGLQKHKEAQCTLSLPLI